MDHHRFPGIPRDDATSSDAAAAATSLDPVFSTASPHSILAAETEAKMADLRRRSSSLGSQTERKRSKRKSGDKPKRPLSAYNIFFQLERQKLLEEGEQNLDGVATENTKGKISKAKLGFASLARYIAAKWKNIDDDSLAHYQDLADKEQRRYMNELVKWKIQEAHTLYDDVPSTRPDAWVPQPEEYQATDDHLAAAAGAQQPQTSNGWNAASVFLQDTLNRHFLSGDAAAAAAVAAAGISGHPSYELSEVSSMGYGADGYNRSEHPAATSYEQVARFASAAPTYGHEVDWLRQNADGINTRWSRHLGNEMEASVKELSKIVPNRNMGAPYYVQELEPLPFMMAAAAAAAEAAAAKAASVDQEHSGGMAHQEHSGVMAHQSAPKHASEDNKDENSTSSSSTSVQHLSLHLDEEEQQFLIARLAESINPQQQSNANNKNNAANR